MDIKVRNVDVVAVKKIDEMAKEEGEYKCYDIHVQTHSLKDVHFCAIF